MRKETHKEIYTYYLKKIYSEIAEEQALYSRLENFIGSPTRQTFYYWLNRAKEFYNKNDLNCAELLSYLIIVENWIIITTKVK